ncbi:FAD-binding oxidoreductase [Enhygromyxa salina]|uniref:Putative decaprenylphosphoryl-beta-D-ribose oxidase n=1 Tax=Enhygromyxa salina TaxID=215803 RepID=A0A2S9YQM8_9BACT|nr:FAD-binding oxidoreductase [Enhygromyxa salina]PRQ07386.1 putative decaprenylphosphoryl-beta-D-ribose oxidase [Enhygromyxa salina]
MGTADSVLHTERPNLAVVQGQLVEGPVLAAGAEPTLVGWGNLARPGVEVLSEDLRALTAGRVLSRGLGRAYGDSAQPPPGVLEVAGTVLADRILGFDPDTGLMRAEAGLSLHEINRLFIPRGWFPPVTPGTQFVTLGGAVAADVHGKNHHVAGCFGQHVTRLLMRVPDGRVLWCSKTEHPDLFLATIGGMGLTGHVLEVEFRMDRIPSSWIWGETLRVGDIGEYIGLLKQSASEWPMTMGWIDCVSKGRRLGRGVLFRGRWATPDEAPSKLATPFSRLTVPIMLPSWTLNPVTVRAFNAGVYWKPTHRQKPVHWESFFYPLDKVRHWNRAYGRKGFTQYQCVLPDEAGPEAARRFLEVLTSTPGGTSFLCVIKDCGPQSDAMLSFPTRGISIALDIPVRTDTQALVDRLNEATLAEGGRIYLAKDSFTRPDHFRAMEGERLDRFMEVRRRWDPDLRMRSAQSVRVLGDPAGGQDRDI